jgi:catechol 2,3-dioxygenase-like lactoylglutathione lyase family enzyme
MLQDFEQGKMNRRQLIQSLAMAASVAGAAESAVAAEGKAGFKTVGLNHISYVVSDYTKTRDFYAGLMGMNVSHDDGKQCYLSFGNSWLLPRNARVPGGEGKQGKDGKARPPMAPQTPPLVNHIAYTIDNWNQDKVKEVLLSWGLEPRVDTENSFHVKDPDGFDLQISGKEMKP